MKKYIYVVTSFILIISLFTGCSSEAKSVEAGQNIVSITVKTQEIQPQSIEQYATISSKVSSENEVSVIPKISGTVKKVYVSLGDEVKKGDVLFEIDGTDALLKVEQARASLSSAQAGLVSSQAGVQSAQAGLESAHANYEKNIGGSLETQLQQLQSTVDTYQIQYSDILKSYENTKTLYEVGGVSKKELDDITSSLEKAKLQLDTAKNELEVNQNKIIEETKKSSQASVNQSQASVSQSQASVGQSQASVSQAEISLESALKDLENTKVKAEIDGTIGSLTISDGSTANAQSVAMTIVSLDKIKVAFSVSEDVINRISIGSKAYITISAVSEEAFEVFITNISPVADEQTRLYTVEAYIDNKNKTIKPGMFVSIKLVLDQKNDVVSVPLNTVIEKNEEKFVYVVDENNIAHKTIVETGLKNEESIEITNGLQLNDLVVVTGQDFLSDGSTVTIAES